MPQGLPERLPQGLTRGLPRGLTRGLPQGLPQVLLQGLPRELRVRETPAPTDPALARPATPCAIAPLLPDKRRMKVSVNLEREPLAYAHNITYVQVF